jgi:hypothetical protein
MVPSVAHLQMLMGMGAVVGDSIVSTHFEIGSQICVVASAVKK